MNKRADNKKLKQNVKTTGMCLKSAITKSHRPEGLDSRHVFLTVLDVGKSELRVSAGWVPVRACFLACRQLLHAMCSRGPSSVQECEEITLFLLLYG